MDEGSTKKLDTDEISSVLKKNSNVPREKYAENKSMNNNDNVPGEALTADIKDEADIDDLMKKSIEKLVEEETNVAKAALNVGLDTADRAPESNKKESVDRAGTSTDGTLKNAKTQQKKQQRTQQNNQQRTQQNIKQKNQNRLKYIIIICVSIAVAVIALVVGIVIYSNNKESYDYNYQKGSDYMSQQDYENAIKYFEKARATDTGRQDAKLVYFLYECYKTQAASEKELELLKDVLSIDSNYTDAIKALADYYKEAGDGSSLNELITAYKDSDQLELLNEYRAGRPAASVDSGIFNDSLEIVLTAGEGEKVYYTLDGSIPTDQSILFNDEVKIDKGTTVLKAVAVSNIGVYSQLEEWTYQVDFVKPNAPAVEPASGTYPHGLLVALNDIPENCRGYYTLDGTIPSEQSQQYTEAVTIPDGNIIFSAIVIDQHDLSSSVIRRNYVVEPEKTYTFDEAVTILKNRMIALNILNASGNATTDGKEINYVYQSRIKVNDVELYLVRFDVKKNGITTGNGFYGIGCKNGLCYKVDSSNNSYTITEF